jgi:hypothetical protein
LSFRIIYLGGNYTYMSNQVVRKPKRITPAPAPAPAPAPDPHASTVVRKGKKHEHKKKEKKVEVEMEEEEEITSLPQIDNTELISSLTKRNVKEEVSKEEMIEQVETQKDILVKNRKRYNEKDYKTKLETIDKLLSKLKVGWVKKNLDDMADVRKKIDKIVLDNKIDEKHFKHKIDLTGEKTDDDPTVKLLVQSRKQFEKVQYLKIPKELEKKDPAKNKGKGFANQPMPTDMLKMINFS